MKMGFKQIVLYVLKYLGVFHLCRVMTQKGLRILCYHNFDDSDAVSFRPKLFIRPDTFAKRLDYLKTKQYPVIGIKEAVQMLADDTIPPCGTVITIDDGWYGIEAFAHKPLRDRDFPYTIYVTSYYAEKEAPIFELAVKYILWKTNRANPDRVMIALGKELMAFTLNEHGQKSTIDQFIHYGETKLDNHGRTMLMKRLADELGVDYHEIAERRIFSLLNSAEIEKLSRNGASIQLHTHRHYWPLELEQAQEEIARNKAFLEPLTKDPLVHFCYPNGTWQTEQLPFFNAMDVCSATTCDAGLNYHHTNPYKLKRYVDGENRTKIEFEAEISGCADIIRKFKIRMAKGKKQAACQSD
jgi:peptidoglycan/xylan/chitin deacetylase (PgdA/CDA1 family)